MEVILSKRARLAWAGLIGIALVVGNAPVTRAGDAQPYGFEAAAQEITQLFWLADTASACGWASEDDAARFKHFSVRFVSAHVTGIERSALLSLVTEAGYEDQVRKAAQQSAEQSCSNARWETAWGAYRGAVEARDKESLDCLTGRAHGERDVCALRRVLDHCANLIRASAIPAVARSRVLEHRGNVSARVSVQLGELIGTSLDAVAKVKASLEHSSDRAIA